MNTKKTIAISLELYEFLKTKGGKGESFDTIVKRLINSTHIASYQDKANRTTPCLSEPPQTTPDQPEPDHSKPISNLNTN